MLGKKTPEQQELEAIAGQMNKLVRKIDSKIDPYNDMKEAVEITRQLVMKRINDQYKLISDLRTTISSKDARINELELQNQELQKKIEELEAKIPQEVPAE